MNLRISLRSLVHNITADVIIVETLEVVEIVEIVISLCTQPPTQVFYRITNLKLCENSQHYNVVELLKAHFQV